MSYSDRQIGRGERRNTEQRIVPSAVVPSSVVSVVCGSTVEYRAHSVAAGFLGKKKGDQVVIGGKVVLYV